MRSGLLDNVIWGILLLLLVPSGLAVASWNSLPGSRLYAFKLTVEQAIVSLAPGYEAKGNLQVVYTERRFSDAKKLLADEASVEGLVYLNNQVITTKKTIRSVPDHEVKKQLAQKYIATLKNVNVQLEEQKQAIQSTPRQDDKERVQTSKTAATEIRVSTETRSVQPAKTPFPTNTPFSLPATRTPTPSAPINQPGDATSTPAQTPTPVVEPVDAPVDPSAVTAVIDDTQQEINDALEELEDIVNTDASPSQEYREGVRGAAPGVQSSGKNTDEQQRRQPNAEKKDKSGEKDYSDDAPPAQDQ